MRNLSTCLDHSRKRGARVRRCALLAIGVAGCLLRAYAMDPSRAMSQYIHDRWGPEQGFPRGPVYAITQTSDGYLWIGTQAGLVRFDGWNFVLMSDSSRNYQIANVLGLSPAPDGSLWIQMQGRNFGAISQRRI